MCKCRDIRALTLGNQEKIKNFLQHLACVYVFFDKKKDRKFLVQSRAQDYKEKIWGKLHET